MRKLFLSALIIGVFVVFNSCQEKEQPWQPLFNGENLDNWDKYLGTPLAGFDSLAQVATVEKVFSVVEEEGVKLIRISGEVNGSLATQASFENYHLRLVFKWGDEVFTKRNSGLLYHSFGEFGAALGTWMVNIEHQLMHENLGDTYLMNNTACETAAVKNAETNNFVFTPGAEILPFGEHANGKSIKKSTDAEKPLGEWNTVDLYCFGQTSVHVVNGVTVMVNNNTGVFENGAVKPLTSGKIQLQSEGGELFVKSIEIQSISKLPKEIMPQ
ncbi:MAG TPA: DUF1080 domain-containing protein [Prolixibacteraceae bacterium]|nr:DUF1080 domain-containing protein [Prolixibacteraceae bacterium]